MKRRFAAIALLLLAAGLGRAQEDDRDSGEGIGPAPREARAVVGRAIEAMGGRAAVEALASAVLTVEASGTEVRERYTLRLDGRAFHYASRRPSGAGFDVVIAREQAFLSDRDPDGRATYVEDLSQEDAREGAYERDVMFMPLLLSLLLDKDARMDYRGRNSEGHEVVRALVPPVSGSSAQPFVIRLLFDRESGLLTSSMGIVPTGHDRGKRRYCHYRDYRQVGPVRLPHGIEDNRGEAATPRAFVAAWRANMELPPELFVRPRIAGGAEDGE